VRVGCAGEAVSCEERVGRMGEGEAGLEGLGEAVKEGGRDGLRRGVRVVEGENPGVGVGSVPVRVGG
jgi:hypothetical protein